MGRGILRSGAAAFLLAGCSWLPFVNSGAPHLTNPAVEACEKKAADMKFGGVGERQATPLADGRYTVVLDVRDKDGYVEKTCTYDPKTGAEIAVEPPKG